MTHITIGSRGSQLALWQSRWVAAELERRGFSTSLEIIKTTGDRITGVPLSQVGGKGLFTKELEEALLAGSIDIAVHSLKDMPTELPEGLTLAATPVREDPRDALIGGALAQLPHGARVGTSSLRRSAQLRHARPDLVIESVRGNLDTRLRKLDEGQFDAIILAAAGLTRLGLGDRIRAVLPAEDSLPAAGQGALGIEALVSRADVAAWMAPLNDANTAACVRAERAVSRALAGSCEVPLGAYAEMRAGSLFLRGFVASPDGTRMAHAELTGGAADPEALGLQLALELRRQGAAEILAALGS